MKKIRNAVMIFICLIILAFCVINCVVNKDKNEQTDTSAESIVTTAPVTTSAYREASDTTTAVKAEKNTEKREPTSSHKTSTPGITQRPTETGKADGKTEEKSTEDKSRSEITSTTEPKTTLSENDKKRRSLKTVMQTAMKKSKYFSVAYIGECEGGLIRIKDMLREKGILEELSFLEDISDDRFYTARGSEVYAVVPADNVRLVLYRCSADPNSKENNMQELAVFNEGVPFILRGNIDSASPDFCIKVYANGKLMEEYTPSLRTEDGRLTKSKGVYDFTPYKYFSYKG